MAIPVHVDLIFRRCGADGYEFAPRPNRFARNRIADRAGRGFVDLLALPGLLSTVTVHVRGRNRIYRGRSLYRDLATPSGRDRARMFQRWLVERSVPARD